MRPNEVNLKAMETKQKDPLAATNLFFEPTLRLVICKIHGFGIHPTLPAVTRHLRNEGHRCRGVVLRNSVLQFERLPLRSLNELRGQYPMLEVQPLESPIPHLKVLDGWCCVPCNGMYLTTSFELLQRHCVGTHRSDRRDASLWEECALQTFSQETKHRRYFRVSTTNALEPGFTNVQPASDSSFSGSHDDRGITDQLLGLSAEVHL